MYRLVSTHVAFVLFLSGLATAREQNDERSAPFRVVSESAFTGKQVIQYENAKANPELPKGTFELLGAGK
jgi:hypothetical protein